MLHRLGASFLDPGLEARYRDFRTRRNFLRDDGFMAGLHTALLAIAAARELFRHGPTLPLAFILGAIAWPATLLLLRARAVRRGAGRASTAAYMRARYAVAFTWRAVMLPAFAATCFQEVFRPPPEDANWPQLAAYALAGSGTVSLFFGSVSFPILLAQHIVLQPLTTALMAIWHGRGFCDATVAAPGGPAHVDRLWWALEGASRWVLSAVFMQDTLRDGAWRGEGGGALARCHHAMLAAYALICLGASTYVMWVMEHGSRVRFLTVAGRVRSGAGSGAWRPLSRVAALFHAVLAAVGFAVGWQVVALAPLGLWGGDGGTQRLAEA